MTAPPPPPLHVDDLSDRAFWRGLAAVAVCAFCVHAVALGAPFTGWDDPLYVTDNARVQDTSWAGLLALWSPAAALQGRFIEFFPLRDTLYWLLWALWGANPVPFHACGFTLHAANCVLLGLVVVRAGLSRRVAVGAALVFAVHAVHVESVVWVAGLKDPLYTLFFLLAVREFLRLRSGSGGRRGVLAALYVGGLLVKSLMVTLPVSLVLLDRCLAPRRAWRRTVADCGALFVLTVPFMWLVVKVAQANDVISGYPGGSLTSGLLTSLYSVVVFASKVVLPVSLCARYIVEPVTSWTEPRALAGFLLLACLGVVVVLSWRRHGRALALVCGWYLVNLLPVLNILPKRVEVADRYQYVPSMAVCVAAAAVLLGRERRRRHLGTLALALVCGLLAVQTVRQSSVWRDEVALFRQVVDQPTSREHSFAWNLYGLALERQGRMAEAREAFGVAAQAPDEFRYLALGNLARFLLMEDNLLAARAVMDQVMKVNPTEPSLWVIRAQVAARQGDVAEAARAWAWLAAREPKVAVHQWNAAVAAEQAGQVEEARRFLAGAVALDPALCPRAADYVASRTDAHRVTLRPALERCGRDVTREAPGPGEPSTDP